MEKRTARSRRLLQPSIAVIEKLTASVGQREPPAQLNVGRLVRRDHAAKAIGPDALGATKRLAFLRGPRVRLGQPVRGVGHCTPIARGTSCPGHVLVPWAHSPIWSRQHRGHLSHGSAQRKVRFLTCISWRSKWPPHPVPTLSLPP